MLYIYCILFGTLGGVGSWTDCPTWEEWAPGDSHCVLTHAIIVTLVENAGVVRPGYVFRGHDRAFHSLFAGEQAWVFWTPAQISRISDGLENHEKKYYEIRSWLKFEVFFYHAKLVKYVIENTEQHSMCYTSDNI